jgi:hypothetical protein
MSKRRRRHEKGLATGQIEWLTHRKGYPTAEERERIIELRRQLSAELIVLAISRVHGDDPRLRALIKKYGEEEVLRAERTFKEGLDMPSLVADDAKSNREYRLRYSRFGAGLPFLSAEQRNDLLEQYAKQFQDDTEKTDMTESEEAERLLLMDWRNWEDLTPPAIPPRPDNYSAPEPGSYPAPVDALLQWGNDLQKHHDFENEGEYSQWRKFIPALTRMALDPGLLRAWPSDPASWAPWHAIHLLGNLQAWESSPALADLADLEDDWLSDHLPHIWADMGREAEPVLWMILDDRSASAKRRGLAAEGLYRMTEDDDVLHRKVVKGFEKILQNDQAFDPTLNAYLISFLRSMDALRGASLSIQNAFSQNRVDLDIITPEELEEDDFEEDDELD